MKNGKLEFIRGIAALVVFFCHAGANFYQLRQNKLYTLLSNWGTESVIVFFILSGIVIELSQRNNPKSAKVFMVNRLKRLYPLYIIGLLLPYSISGWQLWPALGNLFFLGSLQGYIVPVPLLNPILWSLTFEFFFYCMYAVYIRTGYNRLFMRCWIVLSIVCIPLYYFQWPGVLGHFVMLFAFSSIWLIGRYLPLHISKFPKVSLLQAFFLFGLLFLAARIEYTRVYYCVVKYLVFTVVALPIFSFCLQGRQDRTATAPDRTTAPLKWYYLILAYILLLVGIRFFSHSLPSSKLVYSVAPIATLGLSFLMTAGVRSLVLKAALFLGYISYSLYMIHYPVQFFISRYTEKLNGVAVLLISLVVVVPLAYLGQKGSERMFSRRYRGTAGNLRGKAENLREKAETFQGNAAPVVSETSARVASDTAARAN